MEKYKSLRSSSRTGRAEGCTPIRPTRDAFRIIARNMARRGARISFGRPTREGVRLLARPVDPLALRAWLARRPHAFALESVFRGGEAGRWSFYGCDPVAAVRIGGWRDPFERLSKSLRPWRKRSPPADGPPWTAGWVGYVSYEAGAFIAPRVGRPRHRLPLPLAWWGLYDTVLAQDHETGRWYAAGAELPRSRSPLADRLDRLIAQMDRAKEAPTERPAGPTATRRRRLRSDSTPAQFRAMVRRALDYIAAGDVFQVNLAQRFRGPRREPAWQIYERLREANPAAFAAMIDLGSDAAVASSSPELFLSLRAGVVRTRPIKGTRPRTGDAAADARARRELQSSEKERAELTMIVDLERNDLGRVCRPGSIEVTDPGSLEAHPTVFHRAATVRGELRPECDALDLLRAAFPGGSISGAPKVRAMQIIRELERSARGPYCGAIGWIGLDGDLTLNLVIRTLVLPPGEVLVSVGGGIVADSDPHAEYAETLAKAEGMFRALGHRVRD